MIKKTIKAEKAVEPKKVAVTGGDEAQEVPVKASRGGCDPSHQEQRIASGAGHLECKQCGKEIPNQFGVVIAGQRVEACPEDHEAMRAEVGAGLLVCPTCKQNVPNF